MYIWERLFKESAHVIAWLSQKWIGQASKLETQAQFFYFTVLKQISFLQKLQFLLLRPPTDWMGVHPHHRRQAPSLNVNWL